MENSLLCPFCGGEPEVKEHYTGAIRVCCFPCGVILKRDDWNTRPSPWIKITPETMPEDTEQEFLTINKVGTVSRCRGFANECDSKVWLMALSYYMPIPPIPEEN